jgi:hypothetical protein
VLPYGLACFRVVTTANCYHKAVVTGGKHSNDLPQFRWINTLLGNLKTSFSGTFHAFSFDKYARRYLGGTCFRFKPRFSMTEMTERIAKAVYCCTPRTETGSQGRGGLRIFKRAFELELEKLGLLALLHQP